MTRCEETDDVHTSAGGGKHGHRFLAGSLPVPGFGIELPDYRKLPFRDPDHEFEGGGLTLLHREELHPHRNASVGKAVPAHEDIFPGIERRPVLEHVFPADAASHVDLSFIEGKEPGPAVLDLAYCEVGVVAGVLEEGSLPVGEYKASLGSILLHAGFEIHILPLAVGPVLDLPGDRILAGIDSQGTGKGDEEYVAGADVRVAGLPDAGGRHGDLPSLQVAVQLDVVPDP